MAEILEAEKRLRTQRIVSAGAEINFIRPITVYSGRDRIEESQVGATRQLLIAEVRIDDRSGCILATGTGTRFLTDHATTSLSEATSCT